MRVSATTPITVMGCGSSGTMGIDVSADWIHPGKGLSCSSLRDQRDIGIGAVGSGEIAPGDERNLHGGKIAGVNPSHVDRWLLRLWHGMIRACQVVYPGFSRQRRGTGDGHRLHARQLRKRRLCAIGKGQLDRFDIGQGVVVPRSKQVHLREGNVAGVKSAILP